MSACKAGCSEFELPLVGNGCGLQLLTEASRADELRAQARKQLSHATTALFSAVLIYDFSCFLYGRV
jgi:hypothetical protein